MEGSKIDKAPEIEPGQAWEVDLFRPEDARGVAGLFFSVYGEGYPLDVYLRPDRLIEENAAGRIISSVARTTRGDIVGHNALFHSAPHPGIFESGAGLVHGAYRGGKGLFTKLVAHGPEVAAWKFPVEGIFGESVCNHVFSQRLTLGLGWVTQAVEVDLMPAAAYSKEKSAAGRVASLVDFISLRKKPHTVYLPMVYEKPLRFLYGGLDDRRTLLMSDKILPSESRTGMTTRIFDFAQVARIALDRVGAEFPSSFHKEEEAVLKKGVEVIQVWVKLAWPWSGQVVDELREREYFLGGILPRWFDEDGLLMQKIMKRPDWEEMQIHTERARTLVDFVRTDWENTTGLSA